MPRTLHRTQGLLVRATPVGSGRVVTLYTAVLGRVAAFEPRPSRRTPRLTSLVVYDLELREGAADRLAVDDARIAWSSDAFARDLDAAVLGANLVEAAAELAAEGTPDGRGFGLLCDLLGHVAAADGRWTVWWRGVLALLEIAGHGLRFDACVRCGTPVPPGRRVWWEPACGGVVCSACGGAAHVLSAAAAARARSLDAAQDPGQEGWEELADAAVCAVEHVVQRRLRSAAALRRCARSRDGGGGLLRNWV